MNLAFNLLGWAGAFVLVATYFAVTLGKVTTKDSSYHILNILAGLALGVSSYHYTAFFSVALNSFWVAIATFGLVKDNRSANKNLR